MGKKRRGIWVGLASLPIALWVLQCTPAVGCWSERTHVEGRRLGFTVGMDQQAAADIVEAAYDAADVSVWSGGTDLLSIKTLHELKAMAAPFQQWRFRNRHRPYCAWDRNVVLVFRDSRLLTIKDELSITYP